MSRSTISRRSLLVAAPVLAFGVRAPADAGEPASAVATTRSGRVRGFRRDGVQVFLGVPYGADTAPRRFMPPRAPDTWPGIRDALDYGPACPQGSIDEPVSEDCLRLNVWTPGLDDARRPVMVYVHGGAYSSGSGSSPLYDGAQLCRRGDVVVVTLNHRLGLLGYLYLGRSGVAEFADSGNAGQLDLVLALQWVRDHIAGFGGDPGKVMVFGQSGGGAKIATLMAMPAAAGLFHRAATMSGQQVTASGPLNAQRRTQVVLDALGLPGARADELRNLPVERLLRAAEATDPVIGKGRIYFGPVLDERSLTRHPFFPDAPARSARIPMIIGNTRDETRNLIGRGDPGTFELDWARLPERLAPEMRVDVLPEHVIAEYRRWYPQRSASDVFFAATTAARSWRGALLELEARARQGAPTWSYQLDFASPDDDGRWGAYHGLDIPLVFGTLAVPHSGTGTGPPAQAVARELGDAFLALARAGDPNQASLPDWPVYDLERRATMVFDTPAARLVDDPRGNERRLFERVPFIQQGT